jgi:hypothetical protein
MLRNWTVLSITAVAVTIAVVLFLYGPSIFSAAYSSAAPLAYNTNFSSVLDNFPSLSATYYVPVSNSSYLNETVGYDVVNKAGVNGNPWYEINLSVSNATGDIYKLLYVYPNGTLSPNSLPSSYTVNFSNARQVQRALAAYAAPFITLRSYIYGNITGGLAKYYPNITSYLNASPAQQTLDGFDMSTTTYTLTKPYSYGNSIARGELLSLVIKTGRLESNPSLMLTLYTSATVLPPRGGEFSVIFKIKSLS